MSQTTSSLRVVLLVSAILLLTATVEWQMGRSVLGPDGKFGWWESNTHSQECSQRLLDPYSFSHVAHGILFYLALWLFSRRLPVRHRFLIALALEAAWEMIENSPMVINRYRQATIALGYDGDSILNSMSDILMMATGFLFAWRMRPWASLALLLAMEIGCAFWIHDNLTLNVIMLLHPFEAIKLWQMGTPPNPNGG